MFDERVLVDPLIKHSCKAESTEPSVEHCQHVSTSDRGHPPASLRWREDDRMQAERGWLGAEVYCKGYGHPVKQVESILDLIAQGVSTKEKVPCETSTGRSV
ncbi:unnamed protein product [Pleuronectes platessa]|uniref:Uncharacterized protein n=1 Tax=Pleuronectes platessa TaxID=8262 RepID=A0A9N7UH89_PLEPL|nr:unnamed protein product [Pleuronectes platessa]